jgi:hypothetical protein
MGVSIIAVPIRLYDVTKKERERERERTDTVGRTIVNAECRRMPPSSRRRPSWSFCLYIVTFYCCWTKPKIRKFKHSFKNLKFWQNWAFFGHRRCCNAQKKKEVKHRTSCDHDAIPYTIHTLPAAAAAAAGIVQEEKKG